MANEMTNEEIDRLIHEKVMGLCYHVFTWNPTDERTDDGRFVPPFQCSKCLERANSVESNPSYTTDLNAAMKAVEKMRESWEITIQSPLGDSWEVTFDSRRNDGSGYRAQHEVTDASLPRAICLAIIAAAGLGEKNGNE